MIDFPTSRSLHLATLVLLAGAACGVVAASPINTDPAGTSGTQPFNNMQPSLAVHFAYPVQGTFGNGVPARMFAYSDAKMSQLSSGGYWVSPAGQLMPIGQNQALFSQIGTSYGGNGASTFAIPDMRGRAAVAEGQGLGLSSYVRGGTTGQATQTLTTATMPAHVHPHAKSLTGVTGSAGGGQAVSNLQPSIALNWSLTVAGTFPSRNSEGAVSTPNAPFIGQLMMHTGTVGAAYANRFQPANGGLVPVSQNTALFAILGTTFGGNGQTTFARPDLRGRLGAHVGQGPGLDSLDLGQVFGTEVCAIGGANLPLHAHAVSSQPSFPATGFAGGSQPFSNAQPTLAVNYLICIQGEFPIVGTVMSDNVTYLGEIIAFAGNFTPDGYIPCNGQLMPVAQNTSLFSLLGTTFGGNGATTFALPDLRGRVPVGASLGAGGTPSGTVLGVENLTLSTLNMPSHTHTLQPYCDADIGAQGGVPGHDGQLDNNDFIVFINYFFASNPVADFGKQGGLPGGDGQFDNNDFIAFISAFFSDCPWD